MLQAAEYWQMAFLAMLSIVQGSVVWSGLVSGQGQGGVAMVAGFCNA